MPETEQPPASLPREVIEAIVTAANSGASLPPEKMEGLGHWLSDEWGRALRRARAKCATRLTMDDVNRLETAYRNFRAIVDELQDRSNPPPRIPESDGWPLWEFWIEGHQAFGFPEGRPPEWDRRLVGVMLALYEHLSGRPASASKAGGPTMRFLKAAFRELENQAPPELRSQEFPKRRSNFHPPSAGALKDMLTRLRAGTMRVAAVRITKIIGCGG